MFGGTGAGSLLSNTPPGCAKDGEAAVSFVGDTRTGEYRAKTVGLSFFF